MSKKLKRKKGHTRREISVNNRVTHQVKAFFGEHPSQQFGYMGLLKYLGLRDKRSKEAVKKALSFLEINNYIRKLNNKYLLNSMPEEIIGRVDHVNRRFAYVIVDDEDVWVQTDDLQFAVHDDTVAIEILQPASKTRRAKGRVVKVIERARTEFVGRIEVSEKFSFVIPDNRNIYFDIFVYPNKIENAVDKDKVLVEIDRWHDQVDKSPFGKVKEVLGQAGENEAEIHSIMAEFGLPFRFPDVVEKAALKIPKTPDQSEVSKRRSFLPVTTFTVDPEDAKDFDDALSVKKIKDGKWEIGIHISDVSHYVLSGSILDKEAAERATSVYLVDRTIPMLPKVLSNELCSLRPNEKKLTFSAVFEMNENGNILSRWFGRTITESDRRFTYEEAQERIESGRGDHAEELRLLNLIAVKLRKKRFKEGSINFDTTEIRFKLDEDGKPLSVIQKVRKDAHKMIEEFMLLANREIATFIYNMKPKRGEDNHKTFIYRIHDDPDPDKLEIFAKFAKRFGHQLSLTEKVSHSLNKLMSTIEGKPEQNILEQLAIRSMAKAKYTTAALGHFGLAFEHYTHFTSPIRRYPDIMVHRLLQSYLNGIEPANEETYEQLCVHSTDKEKCAVEAERASVKFKQVEFMSVMIGNDFDGIISGVTEWGIFVELSEIKCEGMVRLSDLSDDYYDYDAKRLEVVGRRNKKILCLGDAVKVKVVKTDVERRTIDLLMLPN